jgi:sugar lactone lactonase YvrE
LVALSCIGFSTQDTRVTVFAGSGLAQPFTIDFDRQGNAYVCEMEPVHRVVRVAPDGTITPIAGIIGQPGDTGDYGPATAAKLNGPHNLLIAPDGSLLVADTFNNRVRRIDLKTGRIAPFAGTGFKGFAGDGGNAVSAQLSGAFCIALDPAGKGLYIADLDNRRIRRVDMKSNLITTVAGNGQRGMPHDGANATDSPLVDPRAVAVDRHANIYIVERSGNALRVVDSAGKIRTVVGTGKAGYSGDGGPALQATMNGPKHLCIDRDDSVLIADTENHVIRRYDPKTKVISRVAGTGKEGAGGVGGSPLQLELARPHGVIVGKDGAIYISDSDNDRVVKIER